MNRHGWLLLLVLGVASCLPSREMQCEDACELGEKACADDAVIECLESSGGCADWGEPVPCPAEAPVCASGACEKGCPSSCPAKDPECLSATTLRTYGDGICEQDACSYPHTDTDCSPGSCEDAGCQDACQDECEAGERDCQGAATVGCGEPDGDGCRRWSEPVACPTKAPECVSDTLLRTYESPTCSQGECAYAWNDADCTPDRCDAGACQKSSCQDGETDCSGECIDTQDGDGSHCGGCDRACAEDPNFCLGGNCEDPGEISCQSGACCRLLGADCNPYFQMCCGDQNAIGCVNWICQYW